ncbi:MAG: hypothetical protein IIA87_00950 [Nanoarchaeota archaeon]|nr:hypothetical protein [Nanoarchaeota archaeon]
MDFRERLVEVIREGEIVKMSESEAMEEDLFILRRVIEPVVEEKEFTLNSSKATIDLTKKYSRPVISFESWRSRKFEYEKNNVIKELVDNFHWVVIRARRNINLTRKKLASAIGVPEDELKIVEFGGLPRDDFVLINKIENRLGINLRKEKKKDEITLAELQKMDERKIREEIEKTHLKEAKLEEERERISGSDIEILED